MKTIKGKKIVRNGSPENPAVLVLSDAGNEALKLMSELTRSIKKKNQTNKPKMFLK